MIASRVPPLRGLLAAASLASALLAAPAAADVAADVLELERLRTAGQWAAVESLATQSIARERGRPRVDSVQLSVLQEFLFRARMLPRATQRDSAVAALGRDVLAVRLRHLGPDHPLVGEAHYHLGRYYGTTGRNAEAEPHARRAQEIRSRVLAPDDTLVAEAFRNHAQVKRNLGDNGEAFELYDRALAVRRRAHGEDHRSVAMILAEQGHLLRRDGHLDGSRETLQRSLAVLDRLGGPDHFDRIFPLDYLALTERDAGNLDRALELHQEAIRIAQRRYPEGHEEVERLMRNTNGALLLFGDYAGSRAMMERLVPRYLKRMGPDHPSTLAVRQSLGAALTGLGDSARAMTELRAAEAGWAARPGPPEPGLATTRLWIGGLLTDRGDHRAARVALEQAQATARAMRSTDWSTHADVQLALVRSLVALADTAALGREDAELVRLMALPAARQSILLPDLREAHARALRVLGRESEAWSEALAADVAARDLLRDQARALPDRRALQLSMRGVRTSNLVVSLSAADAARAAVAWNAVARTRGLVRDEMARRRIPRDASPATVEAHGAWMTAQRGYAQALVRARSDSAPAAALDGLRAGVESAEMQYARTLGRGERATEAGLDSCLARLRPGQALVAFVETDAAADTARLVAWVARGGDPKVGRVDLGPSRALRGALAPWRDALARPPVDGADATRRAERECRRLGAIARAATWDRLAARLEDAREVYVVPDGPVLDLPWQALPAGAGYLVERGPTLRVLTAERDLLDAPERGASGLLAVGDPDFGGTSGTSTIVVAHRAAADPCAAGVSAFGALPATGAEVAAIARGWRGPSRVLTGAEATEQAFKAQAAGREVLHLATHGLVARDTCGVEAPGARGLGGLSAPPARPPAGKTALAAPRPSPWLGRRVWLAFAGANEAARAPKDENEGLLTAEEVLTLDLSGTDWVVLSACHTGTGESWSREGVVGMRRAFHLAGARTVFASHWSVDDEATREWMTALYAARGRDSDSPGAAVTAASRAVLAERRACRPSTHPFFWAAFDATGE